MLELNAVNSFYGGAHILRDVSLAVPPGQVVALLGRNGAGKTTTMKSIIGMVTPRSGSIRYNGQDMTGWLPYRVCRLGIGYVPEERRIFGGLTVLENLEVGRHTSNSRHGLKRATNKNWTLEALFTLFPNLAERQRNLGSQLSGGEQQMLTIARTLMGNPETILLDEPSEGVAPVIVEQMIYMIEKLKQEGLAILLSEQNIRFAEKVSDQAYIIESGVIQFSGPISDLAENPDIRERYLAV